MSRCQPASSSMRSAGSAVRSKPQRFANCELRVASCELRVEIWLVVSCEDGHQELRVARMAVGHQELYKARYTPPGSPSHFVPGLHDNTILAGPRPAGDRWAFRYTILPPLRGGRVRMAVNVLYYNSCRSTTFGVQMGTLPYNSCRPTTCGVHMGVPVYNSSTSARWQGEDGR